MNYGDSNNVFVFNKLFCCFSPGKGRTIGIYFAGMLFAMAWWVFIDGLLLLSNLKDRQVAPGIEDWVPGILTTLGLIVVNTVNKSSLERNDYYGEESYVVAARIFLFLGFALLAGGVSGSVSVLVTKYIYHEGLDYSNTYLGITDVVQSSLIMLSTVVLWLCQGDQNDQNYQNFRI